MQRQWNTCQLLQRSTTQPRVMIADASKRLAIVRQRGPQEFACLFLLLLEIGVRWKRSRRLRIG
ncbi:MAG: hypothetical protein DMF97_10060 [Acidobacteria bacterium]|nr:MAG: hypothetical protein DMF97_10060 [Acidobacteriota bacterium]